MASTLTGPQRPELDRPYDPGTVEARWYDFWYEGGYFTPQPDSARKPFTIFIPPPNVTGTLTMGHVLVQTLQDVVIRWKRMQGWNALWLPGTDHAGIATQNVVERALAEQGKNREEMGREAFVAEIWKWKARSGDRINQQERRLGCSLDWSRERFTLDEGLSRAVTEVFVRLYEKGLIYRGNYIVNWCPRCRTALSDEEVDHRETEAKLYHLRYPIQGTEKHIVVATTRPETMLGDMGVAVHPKDRRYQKWVGKKAVLPLMRREIPIVADDFVDPKFGTGAVKVTPAHDPNDFEIARRHGLEPVVVLTPDGRMSDAAGDFAGLDRGEARRRVLERLEDLGLLARVETHTHSVGHCSRCATVVEPLLSRQWFVRMQALAEPAIEAVRKKRVRFTPARWTKVYMHWMLNIRDWCISRQLWWGHRIPVYYCQSPGCHEMVVAARAPAACPKCSGKSFEQDEDVLDTWFSSWLWPFSTLGWPEKTEDLAYFYPGNFLVTGPDILFFWVARMIMAGHEFMGQEPFSHVYFNSIVRDGQGRKLSKSLGNSPDPIDVMDQYGADALRFTTIFLTPTGQDLHFDVKRCETGKFFANKLWNASRLVSMRLSGQDPTRAKISRLQLQLADRWILSRYARCVQQTTQHLKASRFNDAAATIYHFTWHEYCDWYLEMVKPRWAPEAADKADARVARVVASRVLDGILHLLHPFMPFVTEEIWQALPHEGPALTVSPWPKVRRAWLDEKAEGEMQFLMELVSQVRTVRSEMKVPPGRPVPLAVRAAPEWASLIEANQALLGPLGGIESWTAGPDVKRPRVAASALVRGAELWIPLEGVIDIDAERLRLTKEVDRVHSDLERTRQKLMNQDFLTKAKKEVVEQQRKRLGELEETVDKLKRAEEALRG